MAIATKAFVFFPFSILCYFSHQFFTVTGVFVVPHGRVKTYNIFPGKTQRCESHVTPGSTILTAFFSDDGVPNVNGAQDIGNSSGFPSGYTSGEYSRVLIKGPKKKERTEKRLQRQKFVNDLLNKQERIRERNEDGYEKMMKQGRPLIRKFLRAPFKFVKRIIFPEIGSSPGTLILVRHGESLWNSNKTFTGWADPDLSERGYREIEHAARLLLEGGYEIDVVFTSRLKRAIRSVWILLQELNEIHLPVFKSWRLNERMYGALTGLSKTETALQLGAELVQEWRGSLRSRPPPLRPSDHYWPGRDRKHFDLSSKQIPLTESLLDCMERTEPLYEYKITYELRKGRNVLVVAHANTLRGLVKKIDNIGDDEIQEVAIPTGIPIVYKFNNCKDLTPIQPDTGKGGASQIHTKGLFLEKPGLLKEALKKEDEWRSRVPGYNYTMTRTKRPMPSLERSLSKLKAVRELGVWAGQFIDPMAPVEDDGNDGNMGQPIMMLEDKIWEQGLNELKGRTRLDLDGAAAVGTGSQKKKILADDVNNIDFEKEDEPLNPHLIRNNPCTTPMPPASMISGNEAVSIRKDAVIVMIRHGKTEHNKLGLFTGWEDTPLAPEGLAEAIEAGRLLRAHGFEFDVVYTSWLSRAIETAWLVMDELDSLWLPIIKTWRLNERMYGDLTGLSKMMVAQRHGEAQFKAWRRGYKVRPPKVSSFSTQYPGNDKRYVKYMSDVRFSIKETLIRSIEGGKLKLSRKLPKTESLHDCMERTIPYFSHQIVPEAINKGKRVLIASSENAIRGLLMHLCDIPEDRIVELEIPNGLPLIFDVKSKCVKLLDDGTGQNPLEVYDFGKSASYLFKPCLNEDGSPDEECDIRFMSNNIWDSQPNENVTLSIEDQQSIESIRRPGVAKKENSTVTA